MQGDCLTVLQEWMQKTEWSEALDVLHDMWRMISARKELTPAKKADEVEPMICAVPHCECCCAFMTNCALVKMQVSWASLGNTWPVILGNENVGVATQFVAAWLQCCHHLSTWLCNLKIKLGCLWHGHDWIHWKPIVHCVCMEPGMTEGRSKHVPMPDQQRPHNEMV